MRAFSAGGKRVRIDLGKRRVYLCDVELHATLGKYSLLPLFFRNTGKEFTSSYIIREIWGAGYGSDTQGRGKPRQAALSVDGDRRGHRIADR